MFPEGKETISREDLEDILKCCEEGDPPLSELASQLSSAGTDMRELSRRLLEEEYQVQAAHAREVRAELLRGLRQ